LKRPRGRRGALRGLTKGRLQELYADRTDTQIAEMYDVSDVAISYFRKKYEIATVTLWQRKAKKLGILTLEDITSAKLIELYFQIE